MQLAQRSTSEAGKTSGGYFTLDRWKFEDTGNAGTWTLTQSTDVPTGYGFNKSFKMDCTTLQGTIGSANRIGIRQYFEGQDLQLIKKGTANAETITVAFWVKSTKTGTFICELYDSDTPRHCSIAYTISVSDTWEHKVVNFPADTTGAYANDNGASMILMLWTGAGTDFTSGTLQTTWASVTSANRAVGQVNASDSTSNDFLMTGAQLEIGTYTSATLPPFQFESYGDNLARCQRYFNKSDGKSDGSYGRKAGTGQIYSFNSTARFATEMRASPSTTITGGDNDGSGSNFSVWADKYGYITRCESGSTWYRFYEQAITYDAEM